MKKFIFDRLDEDFENIAESTVIMDTGVSSKDVKIRVMNNIAPAKKKHFTKKFFITVIAAAVSAALLGTITAAAAGSFNPILAEHFAGDEIDGTYSGGNIKIVTDGNCQTEMLGIAGDDHHASGVLKIKKSDGTPFVASTENSVIAISDNMDIGKDTVISVKEADLKNYHKLDVTKSAWSQFQEIFQGNSQKSNYSYTNAYFANDSEINLEFHYIDDSRNLKGETLNLYQKSLYLYHIDELVYPVEQQKPEYITFTDEDGMEVTENKTLNDIIEARRQTLKENQFIVPDLQFETDRYYVMTKEELEIDLDLSVVLNYKDSGSSITPVDSTFHTDDHVDYTVNSITVTPFRMTVDLSVNTVKDINTLDNAQTWFYKQAEKNHDIEITLKNNQKVNGIICGGEGFYANGFTSLENDSPVNQNICRIQISYEDQNGNWLVINPKEITSLKFDENTWTK